MSTFTNILQQKINNLEAQIRQLQEQNYNLRRKARWLMEAAASSDMSMLQQPQVQDMPQIPSGQNGGQADSYIMSYNSNSNLPWHPETNPNDVPRDGLKELERLLRRLSGRTVGNISLSYHGGMLIVTWPDGSWTSFSWNGKTWVPSYHNDTGQEGDGKLAPDGFDPWTEWMEQLG